MEYSTLTSQKTLRSGWGTRPEESAFERHAMRSDIYVIGFGALIGGGIGGALASAMHQPQVWLPLGIGIGLAIGVAIRDRRKNQVARS
jgi:hypothetical protein